MQNLLYVLILYFCHAACAHSAHVELADFPSEEEKAQEEIDLSPREDALKYEALLEQYEAGVLPEKKYLFSYSEGGYYIRTRGCSLFRRDSTSFERIGSFNIFFKHKMPGSYRAFCEYQNPEVKKLLWHKELSFSMRSADNALKALHNNNNYTIKRELNGTSLIIKINNTSTTKYFAVCDDNVRFYNPFRLR